MFLIITMAGTQPYGNEAYRSPNYLLPWGECTVLAGDFGVGRAAIEKHFEAVLPTIPDDLVHQVTTKNAHYVTPDLVIIDTEGENYRKTATGSREILSVDGFTMIAIRERGEWLWAGIRGALVSEKRLV